MAGRVVQTSTCLRPRALVEHPRARAIPLPPGSDPARSLRRHSRACTGRSRRQRVAHLRRPGRGRRRASLARRGRPRQLCAAFRRPRAERLRSRGVQHRVAERCRGGTCLLPLHPEGQPCAPDPRRGLRLRRGWAARRSLFLPAEEGYQHAGQARARLPAERLAASQGTPDLARLRRAQQQRRNEEGQRSGQ